MIENIINPDLLVTLQNKVDAAKTLAVFGHHQIDGDALGSILWFGSLLEKLGKDVSYFTTLTPANSYNFIPWIEKVQTTFDYEKKYDLLVFLDFSWYGRIDKFTKWHEDYFDRSDKIVIDHHLGDPIPWILEIKDINSSSCCWWLYEVCSHVWPAMIDANIATYRYLGLTTDTGNFMRGKTPERDFMIASALLEHGANRDFIVKNIFYANKPALVEMGKIIFNRATIKDHTMYTRYTQDELDHYELADDDVEVVQIPLKSVAWIPLFLRLRYMGNHRSGSMRSGWTKDGNRISVQKIAITFTTGGGHMYAAGFATAIDTTLSLEEDVKRIVDYVNKEAEKQL